MITGHLGHDARVSVHNNDEYASFSVGVNRRYKGSDGQMKESSTWYNCTWWKPNAAKDFLKKGQMVLIEGRPNARHFKTRNGEDAASIEVQVQSVELLGRPQEKPNTAAETPAAPADEVRAGGDDLPF